MTRDSVSPPAPTSFAIVWHRGPIKGTIKVIHGTLSNLTLTHGRGTLETNTFTCTSSGPCRLVGEVTEPNLAPGAHPTQVIVATEPHPFSFLLRDVSLTYPILIPPYDVAVTDAEDPRGYEEIEAAIHALHARPPKPETSFEQAAQNVRQQVCETWLGVGRDMRIFRVWYDTRAGYAGAIQARYAAHNVPLPGYPDGMELGLMLGRGAGPQVRIKRSLEGGVLPILHTDQEDGTIHYQVTTFATLEARPLASMMLHSLQQSEQASHKPEPPRVRGTHYLVADGYSVGHMHTPEQSAQFEALAASETLDRDEETVLMMRVRATNAGTTPAYAFLTGVTPKSGKGPAYHLDDATGFGVLHLPEDDKKDKASRRRGGSKHRAENVYAVMRLNGRAMREREIAVLLKPGEEVVMEVAIPHRPLTAERAARLAAMDFDVHYAACRAFWRHRLADAAMIHVPEPRIDQMIRAGLLHLDLISYGLEPEGVVAPCIGLYCPIGSESAPIIQVYDSVGWHKLAERALQYFVEKQHHDGMMQNFGGYMLETGAVLWTMGQHFRATQDAGWVRAIAPNIIQACEYLREWRARSPDNGLIAGKVADPEDPYQHFMLNGYACIGLQRASEMLATIEVDAAKVWADEAAAWREAIRQALTRAMATSPAVPLEDGTWALTAPAWAEAPGPAALHLDGAPANTHHTVAARDSLLGPLYLVLQEVLEPRETATTFLLRSHNALFTDENVAFSQPYYARHAYVHLRRGEVKAFLKAYYGTVAALADRETGTFWEHYYGVSPHKTHEEAWFLMQTRWMLWLEEGDVLRLLPGIPRVWLTNGKRVALDRSVTTLGGAFSLRVTASSDDPSTTRRLPRWIEAEFAWQGKRKPDHKKPKAIVVRLPHPAEQRAVRCEGGDYDPESETVQIEPTRERVNVRLRF